MASKAFVAVSWSPNQLIDEDSLDQMNNNIVYLRDQGVDGLYQHGGGGGTTTGIKILCGRLAVPARRSDNAHLSVHFRNFFTANSAPVITTSINSPTQNPVFLVIAGLGKAIPDHRGFRAHIQVEYPSKQADRIRHMWVHWIAMGY